MKRSEAYKWLSEQLGLPTEYTHIGMFNPETCAKVVDVSKKYLETMRFALRKQDKIKAHFEPHGDEMLNRIKESLTRYFSADRSDFPSRAARPDPAPARKPASQRRHVTGRNKQINVKATDETIQLFYDITDELGQPMGAVLDLALRALARERGI